MAKLHELSTLGYDIICVLNVIDDCAVYHHSYSPNKLLVWLNLSFTLITLIALLIDWLVFDPLIQYVTLLYGTFIGWYGIMDIWDDTISRTVEGSDAYACFQMWKCCLPRCVGVQFAILAILCQLAGLYFALVSLVGERFSNNNIGS